MKKLLLSSIFISLTAFSAFSQLTILGNESAVITNDTLYINALVSDEVIKTNIFFTNTGDQTVDVMVRKTDLNLSENSNGTLCWNDFCHSLYTFDANTPITLEPGVTSDASDFFAEFYPGAKPGVSMVKLEFFNELAAFETVSLVLILNIEVATGFSFEPAITQWELRDARPNPARDHTVIGFAIPAGSRSAQLVVRNLVGNIVLTQNLDISTNRVRLNTQNLANGIYIYSLIIDNQAVSSKRLVVSN